MLFSAKRWNRLSASGPKLCGAVKKDRSFADKTPENISLASGNTTYRSAITDGWHSEVDDGPMYGEYIPYSIEEVLELEFEDIDSSGD